MRLVAATVTDFITWLLDSADTVFNTQAAQRKAIQSLHDLRNTIDVNAEPLGCYNENN